MGFTMRRADERRDFVSLLWTDPFMTKRPSNNGTAPKLLAAGLLVLILLLILLEVWRSNQASKFSSSKWKEDNLAAFSRKSYDKMLQSRRDLMVDDFLKKHRLMGMKRSDIVELLGEPDTSRKLPFEDWDMINWSGPEDRG